MDVMGFDVLVIVGAAAAVAGISMLLATIIGAALLIVFWKTNKVILPNATLTLMTWLDGPIKTTLWLFKLDEKSVDLMKAQIINRIYEPAFKEVPFKERAIFFPQCLRSMECPGPLTPEGIKCVGCGRCNIKSRKAKAEKLGYKVFIAPGSSVIRRMVTKHQPKAVIGIGCPPELSLGAALVLKHGIIPQGVPLLKSGCVETMVDWDEVDRVINLK